MKSIRLHILFISAIALSYTPAICETFRSEDPTSVLYNRTLSANGAYPELLGATNAQFTESGLRIHGKDTLVKLNYYYALAERLVRYHVRLSSDSKEIGRAHV